VKHSAPLARRDLAIEVEEVLSRGCADAIIVTGSATGRQAAVDDLKTAKAAARGAPVIAGSGVDPANLATIFEAADALIVGTAFKQDGVTTNAVDGGRVHMFMRAVARLRSAKKRIQFAPISSQPIGPRLQVTGSGAAAAVRPGAVD
jgi:predicted TIM-barrel enzyme